jgi:hypothetical protein
MFVAEQQLREERDFLRAKLRQAGDLLAKLVLFGAIPDKYMEEARRLVGQLPVPREVLPEVPARVLAAFWAAFQRYEVGPQRRKLTREAIVVSTRSKVCPADLSKALHLMDEASYLFVVTPDPVLREKCLWAFITDDGQVTWIDPATPVVGVPMIGQPHP